MYTNKGVHLKDNERLQKVNAETGEVTDIPSPAKPKNPFSEPFIHEDFLMESRLGWECLATQTNDQEFKVAQLMSKRIQRFTNSLQPLNDETTVRVLAEEFDISVGRVKTIFDKLFKLGVYARFEVSEWEHQDFIHKRYWVFNPFLTTRDKNLDNRSKGLFSGTLYARIWRKED